MDVLPILAGGVIVGLQLEYCGLGGVLVYVILNVAAKTNDNPVEEVVRLAGAVRAVILVVLVQLHGEVAVHAKLRQAACECLVRV